MLGQISELQQRPSCRRFTPKSAKAEETTTLERPWSRLRLNTRQDGCLYQLDQEEHARGQLDPGRGSWCSTAVDIWWVFYHGDLFLPWFWD